MSSIERMVENVSITTPIKCVEMHTTGEPTRIVYSGFPTLTGTLLEKRAQAREKYDHIRRRLMLEPRGHWDMYGAVLIPETELVAAGKADMGVIFMHNDGFSTMCGHASIALGRFLIDTDESIFPRRKSLVPNNEDLTVMLHLHVPSGVLQITVPVLPNGKSDPSKPVSFLSVPSFTTGLSVQISLPASHRWPELGDRTSVTADFSYGGAYYCLIHAAELGFPNGLSHVDMAKMSHATKLLKAVVNTNPDLRFCTTHLDSHQSDSLYSVMIVDKGTHQLSLGQSEEETGLCFFANQQVDRSPTGGCVAARVALAYTKKQLAGNETRIYHSILSKAHSADLAFTGSVAKVLPPLSSLDGTGDQRPQVLVKVEGRAFYTGLFNVVVEEKDVIGADGFALSQLQVCQLDELSEVRSGL